MSLKSEFKSLFISQSVYYNLAILSSQART